MNGGRKKQMVAVAAAAVLIVAVLAVYFHFEDEDKSEWLYYSGADGVTIYSYTGNDADVKVPETIDGMRVIEIGIGTFLGNDTISSVTAKSVTHIGDFAFINSSLERAYLPAVETVGTAAFTHCTSLKVIDAPNLKDAGVLSLSGTGLEEIYLPSLATAGNAAFQDSPNLISVDLPNLTSIGEQVFLRCTALSDFKAEKLETIGELAFSGCTSLESIYLPSLTELGESAFHLATGLRSFAAPNLVKINDFAFYGCSSLEYVEVQKASDLGDFLFIDCTSLKSVILSGKDTSSAMVPFGSIGSAPSLFFTESVPEFTFGTLKAYYYGNGPYAKDWETSGIADGKFFMVSFIDADVIKTEYVIDGQQASYVDLEDRDGNELAGWSNSGTSYDFSLPVTDDLTLTAVWEKTGGTMLFEWAVVLLLLALVIYIAWVAFRKHSE